MSTTICAGLVKFHLYIVKSVRTPIASRNALYATDGKLLADPAEYRSMVGALHYFSITRPDIAYVVHVCSQFMQDPRTSHFGGCEADISLPPGNFVIWSSP